MVKNRRLFALLMLLFVIFFAEGCYLFCLLESEDVFEETVQQDAVVDGTEETTTGS